MQYCFLVLCGIDFYNFVCVQWEVDSSQCQEKSY